MKKDPVYTLEAETTGFWFWKKNWAIYRHYSYMMGEEKMEGKGLIGRYKTIISATKGFEKLRGGK